MEHDAALVIDALLVFDLIIFALPANLSGGGDVGLGQVGGRYICGPVAAANGLP